MAKERQPTPQQIKFADAYIRLGVAEESALEAGYSKNYAKAQSYKLLEKVGVKKYIDQKMAELSKPAIASADEVLQYLT